MTDHQQAAIEAAAKQHSPHLWDGQFRAALLRTKYFTSEQAYEGVEKNRAEILAEAEEYITAAEPHLRKKWAEEVLNEGILGAGYSALMNPNRGEHPVATFTRAVKHMVDLLEGAGE